MRTLTILTLTAIALGGCTRKPAFLYGDDLTNVVFHLAGPNMGVYPDQSVLSEPNNPFANDPPNTNCAPDLGAGCTAKWLIQANAGAVVGFYSWATLDAITPSGENQYYAALDLQQIYQTGQADQGDLPTVKTLAIRGYQAVLDYFPTSVTYDKTGQHSFDLATLSYKAIVALGGQVQGGWYLVKRADGSDLAVRP
jgi:hypothetical protein